MPLGLKYLFLPLLISRLCITWNRSHLWRKGTFCNSEARTADATKSSQKSK